MRAQILRDTRAWDAQASAWDAAVQSERFYLGRAWLRAWWDAFGAGRLCLVLIRDGERVVGLAPLRSRPALWLGVPVRLMESLFNAHAVGSDVYVEQGSPAVADRLLDALDDEAWDVLCLRSVPADSAGVAALCASASRRGLVTRARERARSPSITLTGSWEAYLARRSARFRKNLRHKQNRLLASGLPFRYECATEPARVQALLPELRQAALASWSGRRGSSIASPGPRRFYEPLIPALARQGALRLWTLRIAEKIAAFELHVPWGRRIAVPKAAYDEGLAHLSPGSLLEARALESAFAGAEHERIDLLGDDEPYKLRWTSETESRTDVFVFRTSLRARLLDGLEFRLRPPLGALKRRVLG